MSLEGDDALAGALRDALDPTVRAALARRLRAFVHDANGPLGTIGLELFSAREGLDDPAARDEIRAALANAERARGQCADLVEALRHLARALAP